MPKVLNDSRVAQEIMYGGDIARWDKANQLTVYLNGQSATFDPTLRGVGGWSFSAWWGRIEILANGAAYNNGVMALPPYGSVSNANVA